MIIVFYTFNKKAWDINADYILKHDCRCCNLKKYITVNGAYIEFNT